MGYMNDVETYIKERRWKKRRCYYVRMCEGWVNNAQEQTRGTGGEVQGSISVLVFSWITLLQ